MSTTRCSGDGLERGPTADRDSHDVVGVLKHLMAWMRYVA